MIAIGLWLLATMDGSFAGYREAAGRNALIDKRRYYLRAMIRGAVLGQVAVVIAALVILSLLLITGNPQSLIWDLEKAGSRMLVVYVPFAMMILLAFCVRSIPSVDIRSITSTLIFGPFTLIRPVLAVIGLVYGVLAAPRIATVVLALIVLTMMLSLERALSFFRDCRSQFEVRT